MLKYSQTNEEFKKKYPIVEALADIESPIKLKKLKEKEKSIEDISNSNDDFLKTDKFWAKAMTGTFKYIFSFSFFYL